MDNEAIVVLKRSIKNYKDWQLEREEDVKVYTKRIKELKAGTSIHIAKIKQLEESLERLNK